MLSTVTDVTLKQRAERKSHFGSYPQYKKQTSSWCNANSCFRNIWAAVRVGQAVFIYNYFVFGYSKYVHFEILVNEKKMALAPPVCQKKKKSNSNLSVSWSCYSNYFIWFPGEYNLDLR